MKTNPEIEFYESIVPAYERYTAASEKKELSRSELMHVAMQAANLLYHFRETLAEALPHEPLTRQIVNTFIDYDIIGDVCNVSKHGTLTQKKGTVYVSGPESIEQTVVFDYFFREGTENPRVFENRRTQQRVLIYTTQGEIRDLLDIATNVINYWSEYLFQKGLSPLHKRFHYKGDDIIEDGVIDSNSGSILARVDQSVEWVLIARYYEPRSQNYRRWGWDTSKPGANLVAIEVDKDAPDAKLYGRYSETRRV